jgi:streptogramin lyase
VFFATLLTSLLALYLLAFIIIAGRPPHFGPGPPAFDEQAVVEVGARPTAAVTGFGSVWISDEEAGTLTRIDPVSNAVQQVIDVGKRPVDVAVTPDALWVLRDGRDERHRGTLTRVSPDSGALTNVIRVGRGPVAVTSVFDSIWVANGADRSITKIDATARRALGSVATPGRPVDLAVSEDGLWVAQHTGGASADAQAVLNRFDLETGQADRRVRVDGEIACVTASPDAVFLCIEGGSADSVTTVNPGTVQIEREAVGVVDPRSIALAGSILYVAEQADGSVAVLRSYDSEIDERVDVGDDPVAITMADDDAWVANAGSGTASRVGPTGGG